MSVCLVSLCLSVIPISMKFEEKILSPKLCLAIDLEVKRLKVKFKCCVKLFCSFHTVTQFLCPPLKKEGHIALHMSVGMLVGMSVSLNLVQLITKERFAPEDSNLVRR